MNTKVLMTASSLFMGIIGCALSLMPDDLLAIMNQPQQQTSILTLQLTGAMYFGFAMTNWMARTILIGGIYARPIAIGNFSHFLISALALIKELFNNPLHSMFFIGLTILYVLFAILFGYVLFTHPLKK